MYLYVELTVWMNRLQYCSVNIHHREQLQAPDELVTAAPVVLPWQPRTQLLRGQMCG